MQKINLHDLTIKLGSDAYASLSYIKERLAIQNIPDENILKLLLTGSKLVLDRIESVLDNSINNNVDITNAAYNNLKDVCDSDIDLQIGDWCLYKNEAGLIFGPYKITGFCKPTSFKGCVYLNTTAWWYPHPINSIIKI